MRFPVFAFSLTRPQSLRILCVVFGFALATSIAATANAQTDTPVTGNAAVVTFQDQQDDTAASPSDRAAQNASSNDAAAAKQDDSVTGSESPESETPAPQPESSAPKSSCCGGHTRQCCGCVQASCCMTSCCQPRCSSRCKAPRRARCARPGLLARWRGRCCR